MIEAMKQALEALEEWCPMTATYLDYRDNAITALRQAIAEAEKQEPVKIVEYICVCGKGMRFESVNGVVAPKREWVGLTDEDIEEIRLSGERYVSIQEFAAEIEAKLKEKNT